MNCPFCKSQSINQCSKSPRLAKEMICLKCHRTFSPPKSGLRLKNWLLGSGVLAFLSPFLLNLSMEGLLLLLPKGDMTMASSVVILGRGPDNQLERSLTAAQIFYEQQTNIFVSGMSDAPEILNHLKEMGVPEKYLAGERCSQTTWENGLFSDILMGEHDKENVILITDGPHLLRAHLVFKKFGLNNMPYSVPREQGGLLSLKQAQVTLREYAALIVYAGSGKLWSRSEKEQKMDELQAKRKIIDWRCHL